MAEIDLSRVFDALPVAVAVLTPDAEFTAVNRAYENVSGYSRDQLVGRGLFEVFDGGSSDGARDLKESLERVLADGQTDVMALLRYDVESPVRPGVLQKRYFNVINAPLPRADGETHLIIHRVEEVTSFVEQFRQARAGDLDVAAHLEMVEAELFVRTLQLQEVNQQLRRAQTKERQTSQSLREAVQQQRRMVADTSHDLKGPITGLQTRLQVALAESDTDHRQTLNAALRDAERLGAIVTDLLDMARLGSGAPTEGQPVDVARLAEDELARRTTPVVVTTRLEPGVIVHGSRSRLTRLLGNLLANAERHTTSGIEVVVGGNGEHAMLEVIDDGPGIPAAEREAVFGRFYRRGDARYDDPPGTGLGLPIAREIAHAHGGTLHIADYPHGTADHPYGTRVISRLPLHTA